MTFKQLILATAAIAAPATLMSAAPAQAQVAGIASANPVVAMGNSKAFTTVNQQIETMFKSNLDQAEAKERSRQQLLVQLDKNGDKNVDQSELDAAAAAKNPALAQIDQLENDIATLTEPASRAQAYAIEQMVKSYNVALKKVVTDKKISVVLAPTAFIFAPDSADVTTAITAEMDKTAPSPVTAPPSNWQPTRELLGLQQQLSQYQQIIRAIAAQQQSTKGAAAPAAPAGAKPPQPQPQGR